MRLGFVLDSQPSPNVGAGYLLGRTWGDVKSWIEFVFSLTLPSSSIRVEFCKPC